MADSAGPPDILRLTSAAADLAKLYAWLDEAAARVGLGEPLLGRMHVALEEAVMNVAMHSLGFDSPELILVRLRMAPDAAILEIEDPGPAFDPTAAPEVKPARPEEIVAGGLGLRLLRRYCPGMAYERRDGLNRLTLPFARV